MAIKKRSATVVPGASGAAAAVKNPQASKSSFWGELPQHVMSGISRMVPTLIMGGVILAFSQLIAYSWLKIPAEIGIMDALNSGKFSGFDLSLLKFAWLSQSFGGVLFGFAIPMFAAFVANSIGGKLAFPGWFYRRLDVYPADATAELRSQHYAMGDLFAGAVNLHWCADYFYRRGLPCEVDEPENPVTGFPVSVQNHIFATDSFRHFCHAGDVLCHHPIWWLDQRRYPYRADCRR